MGRVEYLNDPAAPKPNSLVPACGTLAVNDSGQILRVLYAGQYLERPDLGQDLASRLAETAKAHFAPAPLAMENREQYLVRIFGALLHHRRSLAGLGRVQDLQAFEREEGVEGGFPQLCGSIRWVGL